MHGDGLMGEIVELIKASPETFGWMGFVVAFVLFAEKVIGLYSKTSSERRARRKEDLDSLNGLVDGHDGLEKLNIENKHQEAFYRLTRLNVGKERRELVLEILAMGFVSTKAARLLEPLLSVTEEGKYIVAIAISDLFMAVVGMFGLCYVGAAMLALNLAIGEPQTLTRLIILLMGSGGTLFIAFMTLDPIRSIVLAHRTATRLEEKGLLEGKPGVWGQTKQGVKEDKVFTCIVMGYVSVVVIWGLVWGHSLKG